MPANIVPTNHAPAPSSDVVEHVVLGGDLSKLTPAQRVSYYFSTCQSLGLNPLTRPFDYLRLSGKEVLYAKKDACEQLRKLHKVSITDVTSTRLEDVFVVTAKAQDGTGRTDAATGAVAIAQLKGEALANALMKAETKAKRRVTLSICGLGILDETELETMPEAKPLDFDPATGEIHEPQPAVAPRVAYTISLNQQKRLFVIAAKAGWSREQIKQTLLDQFKLSSTKDITVEQYDDVVAKFQEQPPVPDEATDQPF